jgi:hypothetical protein
LGLVAVILAIAGAVYFAYQTWALPAQAESARRERIAQQHQTAEIQIASGQYTEAKQTYQDILAGAPDDAQAIAGLTRAQQLEQAAALYAQATEALKAGDDDEAMRLLQEIDALEPNYRDAASLIDQITTTQARSQEYAEAVKLYNAKDWEGAAQAFEALRAADPNFKPKDVKEYLFTAYVQLADQQVTQANTIAAIEVANGYYQKALSARPLDPGVDTARRTAETFLEGAEAYRAKDWDTVIRKLSAVYDQQPAYYSGQVVEWLYEAYFTTGEDFLGKGDPFSARDRFAEALRVAPTDAQRADAQKKYNTANRLTTPTPTPRPSPTALPSGYVAPAWTRRATGTPDPYPFALISMTYVPDTIMGAGCEWSGVTGRIFDRQGAPLTAETLGVRVTGPVDTGAAAGAHKIIGESGWIVQFDVRAKIIGGFVQVYYKDQPASALIPFTTRNSCYENMLIIDIQQVKALP